MKKVNGGAVVTLDCLYGDGGKGLFTYYGSLVDEAVIVVDSGNGTNKEHGYFDFLNGKLVYRKTNQFPLAGVLNKDALIAFGPGVMIDPILFKKEMEAYRIDPCRVIVDFRCPIILPEDIDWEKEVLGEAIGSTCSGTGKARARYLLRTPGTEIANDIPSLQDYLGDVIQIVNDNCSSYGNTVELEGAQGTMLSPGVGITSVGMDSAPEYPNVTSVNATTAGMLDRAGMSWKHLKAVRMIVKAVPSREGKGSLAGEMDITEIDGTKYKESSSIGGVTRRKGKLTEDTLDLIEYAAMVNGATEGILTFCDQLDENIANVKTWKELKKSTEVMNLVKELEKRCKMPFRTFNTGMHYQCIVDLDDPNFKFPTLDF